MKLYSVALPLPPNLSERLQPKRITELLQRGIVKLLA